MSDVIKNLAKATAHWLEYKAASGFKDANCEALLIVPIVECLAANNYSSKTEQNVSPADGGSSMYISCDVESTKDNGDSGIILETKYLKGNPKRLYIDLLKLALSTDQGRSKEKWDRLLLVAGKTKNLSDSSVIKKLKEVDTVIFKTNGSHQALDTELDLVHETKNDQELRNYFEKNEKIISLNKADRFTIKKIPPAVADETTVLIFSVTRT
jgi:hypothetical protein